MTTNCFRKLCCRSRCTQPPGYVLATRFIPGAAGKYVGGDFFDVFETENGKTALLIGDVTGKGVEAASLAVAVRSTIRAFARMTWVRPPKP